MVFSLEFLVDVGRRRRRRRAHFTTPAVIRPLNTDIAATADWLYPLKSDEKEPRTGKKGRQKESSFCAFSESFKMADTGPKGDDVPKQNQKDMLESNGQACVRKKPMETDDLYMLYIEGWGRSVKRRDEKRRGRSRFPRQFW